MGEFYVEDRKTRFIIVSVAFSAILFIIVLLTFLSSRNLELRSIVEKEKHALNMKEVSYKERIETERKKFLKQAEMNIRKQMRLNLMAVGRSIEDDINKKIFNSKDELITYLNKKIRFMSQYQKTFNNEGDWFVLLSNGSEVTFIMDDSEDCAQPIYKGKPMIEYPGRNRTIYDEVVWQDEIKYILYLYGLTTKPRYLNGLSMNFPEITTTYDMDEHLENIEIFTYKDIKYIQEKYKSVYIKIRELGIVMHYDPSQCEKVLQFITYNKSTTEGDDLYWYFNKPEEIAMDKYSKDNTNPDKEILEVYVIPSGVYGFFNEPKMLGGGVFNKNYVKVSLVAGCQLLDYLKTYEPQLDNYINNSENITKEIGSINISMDKIINKAIRFNWINMIILVCISAASITCCLCFYTRVPYHLMNEETRECYINAIEKGKPPKK